jgi:dihydrofolate synthase/folylpolyglutamate synthase
MPCSTRLRATSAPTSFRVASAPASGEDSLIARYFKPIATDPGAFHLDDDAAALKALGGIELTQDNVSRALRSLRLPGRFQRVPGEVEWIFDVAHNVPAAQGLAENLRQLPRERTIGVCGILGDKDIQGIAAALASEIDEWILVALEGARAVSTEELARHLPPGAKILGTAANVTAGCRVARNAAASGARILVFGSFLTVGPALEYLGPEFVRL